jgi:hypothetical protein
MPQRDGGSAGVNNIDARPCHPQQINRSRARCELQKILD